MEDDSRLGRTGDRPLWIRTGSVYVRAVHLLAASAIAGVCLLGVSDADLLAWWIAAAVSGVLLVVAEALRHRELWREVAGWATVLKLVLIALIPALPAASPWLMSAAFIVAVIGAHSPRKWRHRKVF
jgi:hypothetical protein